MGPLGVEEVLISREVYTDGVPRFPSLFGDTVGALGSDCGLGHPNSGACGSHIRPELRPGLVHATGSSDQDPLPDQPQEGKGEGHPVVPVGIQDHLATRIWPGQNLEVRVPPVDPKAQGSKAPGKDLNSGTLLAREGLQTPDKRPMPPHGCRSSEGGQGRGKVWFTTQVQVGTPGWKAGGNEGAAILACLDSEGTKVLDNSDIPLG